MKFYFGRRLGNSKWYGGIGVSHQSKPALASTFRRGFKIGLWLGAFWFAYKFGPALLILAIGWLASLLVPKRKALGSLRY